MLLISFPYHLGEAQREERSSLGIVNLVPIQGPKAGKKKRIPSRVEGSQRRIPEQRGDEHSADYSHPLLHIWTDSRESPTVDS